jgi:S-DNA-T family DNA segregation ATPase FtsK/SpoIIIE
MAGQKNFDGYNQRIREAKEAGTPIMNPHAQPPIPLEEIPYIIIIIDELADLLMVYGKEVETQIMRLTQKARAAGMHMIIATQRPSADIVTPVIKANCPSRISFQVSNRYDSTTILNTPGAEELLGRGDMFYMKPSAQLQRIHGAFVPDEEIYRVTEFLKEQGKPEYVDGVTDAPEEEEEEVEETSSARNEGNELYDKAVQLVTTENRPSISYLQRRLNIGYNRAANLIEKMEQEGVVSKPNSMGKRRVLVGSGPSMD